MKFNYEKTSKLLNDVTIDFIEEIASEIENGYVTFDELKRNYDDRLCEYCNNYVDVYTSDLLKWLGSCNDSMYFMEQVMLDGYYDPKSYNFDEHLRIAQYIYYENQLLEDVGDFETFLELYAEQLKSIGTFNSTNCGTWTVNLMTEQEVLIMYDGYTNTVEYKAIEDDGEKVGFYFNDDWFISFDEIMRV